MALSEVLCGGAAGNSEVEDEEDEGEEGGDGKIGGSEFHHVSVLKENGIVPSVEALNDSSDKHNHCEGNGCIVELESPREGLQPANGRTILKASLATDIICLRLSLGFGSDLL